MPSSSSLQKDARYGSGHHYQAQGAPTHTKAPPEPGPTQVNKGPNTQQRPNQNKGPHGSRGAPTHIKAPPEPGPTQVNKGHNIN